MKMKNFIVAAWAIMAAGQIAAQDNIDFGVDTDLQESEEPQTAAQTDSIPEPEYHAPKFLWGLRFDTRFDNREFKPFEYTGDVSSKTLFSVRLVPVVGIGFFENHSVMAGASLTLDMGKHRNDKPVEPVIYYNYRSKTYTAFAGKFERRHLIGNYVRAIYAGSSSFYDNVVDGLALQYHPVQGKLELVLDWDGMESKNRRESFRVLSAGEFNPVKVRGVRWFTMGYSFDMYHLANSAGGAEGVVDHMMANPWIGAAFENLDIPLEKLSLQIGWLNSFDRERAGANKWLMPGGATVDFTIQNWKVGIRNRLYVGAKQMPLYNRTFGKQMYKGDPFYHISRLYNYTQIYWRPRVARGMNLDLEVGLHTDGKRLGFQQAAHIGVSFDNEFFRKKRF